MDLIIITQNPQLRQIIQSSLENSPFKIVLKAPAKIYIIDLETLPISQGFINSCALFVVQPDKLNLLPERTTLPTDFITQPLGQTGKKAELLYRLKRLSQYATQATLKSPSLQLDPILHQASYLGKPLKLSPTEFKLLQLFMQHPNQVVSKSDIKYFCWPHHNGKTDNLVEVYIQKLRRKTQSQLIRTIHHLGYKFEDHTKPSHSNSVNSSSTHSIIKNPTDS